MTTAKSSDTASPTVAVVGGGLAGLAAAVSAAENGLRVELFEQTKSLGGRASSLVDAETGDSIDHGQHVAFGCCTALQDFCRHIGADNCFETHRRLHFIAPDGRQYDFAPSRWLPAPLHLVPGLMRLKFLPSGERWAIVGAMARLARQQIGEDDQRTIGAWLRDNGQSELAVERFWSPVLVSALSETVDHVALAAARQVFVDGFLACCGAHDLLVPRVPLSDLFHKRAGQRLAELGVMVHLGTRIGRIEGKRHRVQAILLPDGSQKPFDFVIVAVPWRAVWSLFAEELLAALPALEGVGWIEPGAITTVHLWFDRPITPLPHAVLIDQLGQWVFVRPNRAIDSPDTADEAAKQYLQVVISASHRLVECGADELPAKIHQELQAIWPAARDARLIHSRAIAHPAAVFAMQPGIERLRPPQATPVQNLFLAGDWTSTGWPATMEGAVRSGYLAVEALLRRQGHAGPALIPESPRSWLMQMLAPCRAETIPTADDAS